MYVGRRVVGFGVRAQDDGGASERTERLSKRAAHRVRIQELGSITIWTWAELIRQGDRKYLMGWMGGAAFVGVVLLVVTYRWPLAAVFACAP
jgi:hypothetical protein